MSKLREKAIEGFREGDSFSITRTFTEEDMTVYADITRDYNPVHFDDRFAGTKGLRGRVCHGLLVGSMVTEIGGQVGFLAYDFKFTFKRPVYFGDTITCTMTMSKIEENGWARARAVLVNQDDRVVLEFEGSGIPPGVDERKILAEMVAEGDPTNKLRDD
jgi:acyl dehydratase